MVTNQRASDEPNSLASGKAPPENTGPARVARDTKQTQNLCFGCFEPLRSHWTSINVHLSWIGKHIIQCPASAESLDEHQCPPRPSRSQSGHLRKEALHDVLRLGSRHDHTTAHCVPAYRDNSPCASSLNRQNLAQEIETRQEVLGDAPLDEPEQTESRPRD